ncbi:hypothetical protein JCM16814_23500 [Desulfobaculum senezii]
MRRKRMPPDSDWGGRMLSRMGFSLKQPGPLEGGAIRASWTMPHGMRRVVAPSRRQAV